ncbi:MAG: hypothetical protein U0W40_20305 [Acidimicrobiia bacterium]
MRRAAAVVVALAALVAGVIAGVNAAGASAGAATSTTSVATEFQAAVASTLAAGAVHGESFLDGARNLVEDFRGPSEARAVLYVDGGDPAEIRSVDGWRYFPDDKHPGKWIACAVEATEASKTPGTFVTTVEVLPDVASVKRLRSGLYEFRMPEAPPAGISASAWSGLAGTRGTAKVRDGRITEVKQFVPLSGKQMLFRTTFRYDDVARTKAPAERDITSRTCS